MKHLFAAAITLAALTLTPSWAVETAHDHHHGEQTSALHLNAGKKWDTDAALRKSMADIRQLMAEDLPAIHNNELSAKGYEQLAARIEAAVATLINQCKLSQAADEQLHLIVAELLTGAEQMAGKAPTGTARDGAITVMGAISNYEQYFNDSSFEALGH